MNIRSIVACCVIVMSMAYACEAQVRYRITGTFTNAFWHEEAGDLLGIELRIVLAKGYVFQGTLQWFEGGPVDLRLVNVVVEDNHIILEDIGNPGVSIFEGAVERDGIRGYFKGFSEEQFLRREPGYWEKLGMNYPEY